MNMKFIFSKDHVKPFEEKYIGDYADIMGQNEVINAFKISATGHHHMLLIGPPGSGKTMAASRLSGIIPELDEQEIIEINKIYSIAASSFNKNWIINRPFRTPHNSSSSRAVIGGGPKVLPGEISLAHKGILFLDEFLEFRSDTLQALRTVIEKKEVYISLRNGCAIYPADFLLVAASNPCPCGYYGTEGLQGYYGPNNGGKDAYCALYSLRDPEGGIFNPVNWNSIGGYWEPNNPYQWDWYTKCSELDPGAGYWIDMNEEDRHDLMNNQSRKMFVIIVCFVIIGR